MSKEGQAGRDQSNASSKEHGGAYKESAGGTLRTPLTLEQQGWYERPHEELVELFKNHRQRLQWEEKEILSRAPNYHLSAEDMISAELSEQTKSPNKEKKRFFKPIKFAWDVLAVDRGKWNGERRYEALSQHLNREYPGQTIIKLDPFQIRVIDALTEAFEIPHQRGQAEIEIPQRLRQDTK